jgi:hypothetical protein
MNPVGMALVTTATRPSLPLTDLAACCSLTTWVVIDVAAAERLAVVLKALADPPGCG